MATTSQFLSKLDLLKANPTAIQRLMLRTLSDITDGKVIIVDPTSPFVYLMECAVTCSANAILAGESLTARQYSSNARTLEDVYLHMSDADYINRFAQPSKTTFNILLSADEVMARAVDPNAGSTDPDAVHIKKLTIPKHSEFIAAGLVFTLQYAVDIKVYQNDSFAILYDTDVPSPLYNLTTNQVDWNIATVANNKYLRIALPVQQMNISSQILSINSITGFTREYAFSDQFYYCRTYIKDLSGAWVEIRTTHTEQVYDVTKPTVLLRVLNQKLLVKIPQIYFTSGLITDSLRLDIYTTKGALEMNLSNIDTRSFSARWIDHDTALPSVYSAPLNTLSGISLFNDDIVTGGSDGIGLDALRERVIINGLTTPNSPLTPSQLTNALNDSGYSLVLNKDNITDRQYIATRAVPPPTLPTAANINAILASTAAGCTMQTYINTLVDLVQHATVTNNGDRVTITPDSLFINEGGVIRILTDAELNALTVLSLTSPDALSKIINSASYLYTPYYYVLDISNNQFAARPYRLDVPSISNKYFVDGNDSLLVDVSSKQYSVSITESKNGYSLLLELAVGDVFKAFDLDRVFVQMSYTSLNSSSRIFINGTLITAINPATQRPYDDRYVYEFVLETRFDIDESHNLIHEPWQTSVGLTTEFDIIYIVKNHQPVGATAHAMDVLMDASFLPGYSPANVYRAVTHEKMTVAFGYYLDRLWGSSRSAVGTLEYERYATDVPAVYSTNVYERDTVGNLVVHWNSGTQTVTSTLLHAAGDVVTDDNGAPIYAHLAGEIKLDSNGDPISLGGQRGMQRQLEILFLDGKYFYATSETTLSYRKEVVDLLSHWIINDLDVFAARLLERSELYFHPKSTMGNIEVYTGNKQLVTIQADQSFEVTCYVDKTVNNSNTIKENITRTVAVSLSDSLSKNTISETDIVSALKDALGGDVISVSVTGFTGNRYKIVTLRNSSSGPSVGKRLVALSNKTLAVQDAITITYVEHR